MLSEVSFSVPAGKFFGIAGLSGSGKTTLISLLLRFYEPQRGRICLDGTDIREIPLAQLRYRLTAVFQDVHIFKGTVAENISLFNHDCSDDVVKKAAQMANIAPFIEKMPDALCYAGGYLGSTLSSVSANCFHLPEPCYAS